MHVGNKYCKFLNDTRASISLIRKGISKDYVNLEEMSMYGVMSAEIKVIGS